MIKIIEGNLFDTTAPIIAHQVNCQGKMGSGVAKQVREKYPLVYAQYLKFYSVFRLGDLQKVYIDDTNSKSVVNIFGQDKYGYDGNKYTNLAALTKGLFNLYNHTKKSKHITNKRIAIPYNMGCDRGGESWDKVFYILQCIFEHDDDFVLEIWRLNK